MKAKAFTRVFIHLALLAKCHLWKTVQDKVQALKSNNFLPELFQKQNSMIKQANLKLVSLFINPFINSTIAIINYFIFISVPEEDMLTIKRKLNILDE